MKRVSTTNIIIPIDRIKHKNKKIKSVKNFDFAKNMNLIHSFAHEFPKLSPFYPIIFFKDDKEFKPFILSGLIKNENLFVKDSFWCESYIPLMIRKYPFNLMYSNEEDKYLVCVDNSYDEYLNNKEGVNVFLEDGNLSKKMKKIVENLDEMKKMDDFTKNFCKHLKNKDMFIPLNINIKIAEEFKSLNGAYIINEQRLNNISEKEFLSLRNEDYLTAIYAHLNSLAQIEKLIKLKNEYN